MPTIHNSAYKVMFPFGKFKGQSLGYIASVQPKYLEWLSGGEHNLPSIWRSIAARVMNGEDVSDMITSEQKVSSTEKATITKINAHTVAVTFPYDASVLARLKTEIDGRKWNATEKHWEVPAVKLPELVNVLGGTKNIIADDDVKALYRAEIERKDQLNEIRVKQDTDIEIRTLIPLFPYQRVGVEFVDRAGGRAMIADSMGLGKTSQSIGYAVYKNRRTLIVCPKSVKINWKREIKRFAGKNACVWESDRAHGRLNSQFHIINYDIVDKYISQLNELKFDLLVCDEATYLKNRNTKRAKAVLGSYKERKVYPGIKTPEVIFLTGTPILNRPIEAFTLLNFLDDKRFNNFFHFTQKYGGWKGEDSRNLDDLHERTKDLVIRRLKSEVLTELPPKQRGDLVVELTNAERKQYDELLKKLFRKWRTMGKPTVAEMPAIQSFLIERKIPRLMEVIDELLEADRSVLIFSCYIDPLRQLEKHYGEKAAVVEGSMNSKQRQKSIDALKEGTAKVGLFGIRSGGMGIDGLQHSIDTVIFLDQDWVPANHEQAEDRAHRIGQKNSVQIYYMICEDTIDEYMREILTEKQKIIDTVVDGKLVSGIRSKSVFKEFAMRLRNAYKDANIGDIDAIEDE